MVLEIADVVVVRWLSNPSGLAIVGLCLHRALGLVRAPRSPELMCMLALLLSIWALRLPMIHARPAGGFEAAFDLVPFSWTWDAYRSWSLAMLGAALLIVGAGWRRQARLWVAPALLLGGAYALVGHAAALEVAKPLSALVVVHVLAAGFWMLAPVVLWPRARMDSSVLASRVDLFGRIAFWSVPTLFATGGWLAWRLLGDVGALLDSRYGRLLLTKVLVVPAALALGGVNRRFVARRPRDVPARGRILLRRTLAADFVLLPTAVLAVSAATTVKEPPA